MPLRLDAGSQRVCTGDFWSKMNQHITLGFTGEILVEFQELFGLVGGPSDEPRLRFSLDLTAGYTITVPEK